MNQPTACEIISWNHFYGLARKLARQVRDSAYRPEVIVAIGRGGYLPARILSDFLDLPDLTSFKIEHYQGAHKGRAATVRYPLSADLTGRKVLLVDDVSDSGNTFEAALRHVSDHGKPAEVRTAVLHHKIVSRYEPDYHARKVVKWRWIIYPWAVAEDLGSFIRAMSPRPPDAEGIARRLAAERGIRVPRALLMDVLAMLDTEDHLRGRA